MAGISTVSFTKQPPLRTRQWSSEAMSMQNRGVRRLAKLTLRARARQSRNSFIRFFGVCGNVWQCFSLAPLPAMSRPLLLPSPAPHSHGQFLNHSQFSALSGAIVQVASRLDRRRGFSNMNCFSSPANFFSIQCPTRQKMYYNL